MMSYETFEEVVTNRFRHYLSKEFHENGFPQETP